MRSGAWSPSTSRILEEKCKLRGDGEIENEYLVWLGSTRGEYDINKLYAYMKL